MIVSYLLIKTIYLYQRTLSPDHGPVKIFFTKPVCRYTPTCSEFAIQSLDRFGIKSLPRIIFRVLSCNPFSIGGYNPVVNSRSSKKKVHKLSYSPYITRK